jgi:hypothetical protein
MHIIIHWDSDHYNSSEYRGVRGVSHYQDQTVLYLEDKDGLPQSPVILTTPPYNLNVWPDEESSDL